MADYDFTLTGDKMLIDALAQLPIAIGSKVMKMAVVAGGRPIVAAVKELTPVGRTGNLKASIWQRFTVYKASETVVVTIGGKWPKGAHLHLVEKGTKPRYHKTGRYVGIMPSNPFVAHAFNMTRHLALSKLEASIRRGIKRETKRLAK